MSALKDPSERRNRTKPVLGEVQAAPGTGWQHGPIPAPPDGLRPATVAAWASWMTGTAAAFWTPGDVPALRIIARLHDAVDAGDLVRAGELRLWLDGYGLTPKGRQERRWTAPRPAEAPTAPATVPGTRFAHLRAIPKETA